MSIRVLFITSEIEDFVQVGGLGAVSAALPRALRARTDVRVLLPGYSAALRQVRDLTLVGHCPAIADMPACSVALTATADGLPIYLLICPELYERAGGPYCDAEGRDWPDNDLRFARLASAAALIADGEIDPAWKADLVHANDWQSALTPAYLAWKQSRVPSLLTIHNLAYQGLFAKTTLARIGAPESSFHIDGTEFYGKVSFLKAGLVYASHLTTVSATYAREITTPQQGCGLEGLLSKRSAANQLTGIINGIDPSWDALCCTHLVNRFAAGDWKSRRANSDHVRREFGLAMSGGPLFGLVARLVHQKGVDLVLDAADTIISAGGQIIVMGRGDPHFERALQAAAAKQPKFIGLALRFNGGEARRIFAGSDFTLMPSRFEPCGLSQMYAQRFGSLPIGHNTGGLSETIEDGRTGFLFEDPTKASFLGAICRAFGTFARRRRLHAMRSNAMARTFEWRASADAYRSVYAKVATT
jgi:starch synthase